MKKFLLVLLILVILGGLGYGAYKTVKYIPAGELLVVFDTKEDRILFSSDSSWNFVPYAVIPGRVQLYSVSVKGSINIDCMVSLPELKLLDDSTYDITYGLRVEYSIDGENFSPTKEFLADPDALIHSGLSSRTQNEFTSLFAPYINQSYDPEVLKQDWYELKSSLNSRIKNSAAQFGVEVESISESSILKMPPQEVYDYGILLRNDLLELRKKHKIELETAQHALDLGSLETETYYKKLERLSKIIKDNPEILKYIYIEKIAPNVTAIVPVDKSGYAFGLEKAPVVQEKEEPVVEGQDIDNLK